MSCRFIILVSRGGLFPFLLKTRCSRSAPIMADSVQASPPNASAVQEADHSHADVSHQGSSSDAIPITTSDVTSLNLPVCAADGLIEKPFARPLDNCLPARPKALSPEETKMYEHVLKEVTSWTTIPTTSAKDSPSAPLTEDERMFLTHECLLRYLRATKWQAQEAVTRLQQTLTWRREYGVENLTADYISVENETGKQIILGYDVQSRPCLYLIPSHQNTEKSDRQIQHLVYMLERLIDVMVPDQETLALLVNFNETKSGQSATIGQGRQALHILQNHYPERLGRALVINCTRQRPVPPKIFIVC